MRLPDFWTGLMFASFGIAIVAYAQGFHVPAGAASPRMLPTLVGSFMVLFAGLIALRGWRSAGDVSLPSWFSSKRRIALIAFVPIAVVGYGMLAPVLGSTPIVILVVMLHSLIYGLRPHYAVALGVGVGVVVTYLFIHVLGIPLPAGVIEELLS